MTQTEFLEKLEHELKIYRVSKVDEIIADYKEHFIMGLQNGKTEVEICEKLGSPSIIAKAFETEVMIDQIKNSEHKFEFAKAFKILRRLLILAPFNFFMVVVPGAILFALLCAGWATSVALVGSSLGLLSISLVAGLLSLSFWIFIGLSSASLGIASLGLLIGTVMFYLSKNIILACISYLQWNLKFILEKA